MDTIFMNTKNSKINEPHKFLLSLPQRLLDVIQCQTFKIIPSTSQKGTKH